MSTFGRDATPAPARLTHAAAEELISSRLDGPLDPASNRALLAHLATCPTCRAFAEQMEAMSRGFRALPHLPPSPTVSRQVRERIADGQPWWSRFVATTGSRVGGMQAAAMMLILLGAVAAVLLVRVLGGDNDPGGASTITPPSYTPATSTATLVAASPDVTRTPADQARNETATSTRTPSPTATIPNVQVTNSPTPSPTETVQATEEPTEEPTDEPTATDEPEPTATATTEPSPTETASPEPTATETQRPTEVPPTATPSPTQTSRPTRTPTEEPTDEPTEEPTEAPTETPTEEPTEEPTRTPVPPTATATDEPTETPTEEPTATPTDEPTEEPTETPTEEPTRTPRPSRTPEPTEEPTQTPTPPIEPRATSEGGEPTEEVGQPTEVPTNEPTEEVTEEPTEEPSPEPTEDDSAQIQSNPTIAPSNPEETPTTDSSTEGESPTPDDGSNDTGLGHGGGEETPSPEEGTEEPTEDAGSPLAQAEVLAEFPAGAGAYNGLRFSSDGTYFTLDLGGVIVIADPNGNVIGSFDGFAPIGSPRSSVVLFDDGAGGVAIWDRDTGQVSSITDQTRGDENVVDTRAGWSEDSTLLYLRMFPDQPGRAELHGSNWDGSGDYVIWEGDLDGVLARPVASDAFVWVLTQSGWMGIRLDGSDKGPIENPWGEVVDPITSPGGTLIAYQSGGQIVVTNDEDPTVLYGASTIPYSGGGFAFAPSGDQVVVAEGSGLAIYDLDGNLLGRADGAAVAAPGWNDSGIYFVEQGNPALLRRISPDVFAQE